ncbi:glycosyltransferase 25 family member [Neocloeon triangulifer]|uniref:glycosyltransferase 25 family member n=1 Tax=Neocloeon triangulifer TaxID=2078957 RepID=UPI00286F39A7|nr:glycosyltransferase 25 family member [Neocloeon triangulifer]
MTTVILLLVLFLCPDTSRSASDDTQPSSPEAAAPLKLLPSVVIAVQVRNKAYTLPYFLTALENLNYPKDRLSLWIRSDHNEDNSLAILRLWLSSVERQYHSINTELRSSNPKRFADETSATHWSTIRFEHVIKLKEEALLYARHAWADFIWFLDADVLLTNMNTLRDLVFKDLTVSAPMLESDGMYSNFWCGMTKSFYYKRTEDYKPILNREKTGCFEVPMVHTAVLVNLNHLRSQNLTFLSKKIPHYAGPKDDIITFALSAKHFNVPLHICNEVFYGYFTLPLEENQALAFDEAQLVNIKLEAIVDHGGLELSELMAQFAPPPERDTLGLDKVFMINLKRRTDRRTKMRQCFSELGIEAMEIEAVDGKLLNNTSLVSMGIEMLPSYMDPYHKRPLTMGEIGCFLSHYSVWQKVVDENLQEVLVLEDDIRFENFFRAKMAHLIKELRNLSFSWDLVYVGRKKLQSEDEPNVDGSKNLVWVGYSYWTLGYLLSQSGARKLLDGQPLSKLLPVDEYLPIMFDRHPEIEWKSFFDKRSLVALSAQPLLLYPTHYTGEPGYVSDTEDSSRISTSPQVKRDDL